MTKFTPEFIAEQKKMAKKAYMAEASDADVGLYRSYAAAYYPKALAEIERLEAELKITDELLKEATETIGKAFTRIDQFITQYEEKGVLIKFMNEDELPESICDCVYSAMFNCSHVDGVRLFPYVEDSDERYFLILPKVERHSNG